MHYIGIVEENEGQATGIWFPDLPGCFAAGDTTDEAVVNATEALSHYAEALAESGQDLPLPRSLSRLRRDPDVERALERHLLLLVPAPVMARSAAE